MLNLTFRRRARFVLASFITAVVVTLLAPLVHPVAYALVCSVTGTKLIATADHAVVDDGTSSHDDHTAHCPLCMPAGAPPSFVAWELTTVQPLAHVQQSIPAARLASLVGAPLPARGPPLAS